MTVNIALPKGRLAEKTLALMKRAGILQDVGDPGRKLVFEDEGGMVRYFLVKPWDVPVYVERGVADIGVAGKDIVTENCPDVYELLDLKMGKCRMCVCAKNGYVDRPGSKLRVATKFVNTAKSYYSSLGRRIEVIKLNGSIELAPLMNMSDVIVDLVETGTTLKENDMGVVNVIAEISARLIANKTAYRFKREEIDKITSLLGTLVNENI